MSRTTGISTGVGGTTLTFTKPIGFKCKQQLIEKIILTRKTTKKSLIFPRKKFYKVTTRKTMCTLDGLSIFPYDDPNLLIIEATVPTGFEKISISEIQEKINLHSPDEIFSTQGRVYFSVHKNEFPNIILLRSVDNVNLVAFYVPEIGFSNNETEDVEKIKKLVDQHDLNAALKKWVDVTNFSGISIPTKLQHDIAKENRINGKADRGDGRVMRYRVTCNRAMVHSFTSVVAQTIYGAYLNDKYFWVVDLVDYDLHVNLNICGDMATVTFSLTDSSLHRRCLQLRGPTALRPTIAYNMLRDCKIQPGALVIDPLCGGGSIPIEALYGFPGCIVLCGDIDERAVERSGVNIRELDMKGCRPDVFKWDATRLPFADESVDAICTDLPFGKRCKDDIRLLYKAVLREFSRVIKKDGVVCLLVHKPHLIIRIVNNKSFPLYIKKQLTVNIGGMKCATIYLSRRNS